MRRRTLRVSPPAAVGDVASATRLARNILERHDREHFIAISLNAALVPVGVHVVAVGTRSGAWVHAGDVFKAAILSSAAGIIVAHNHPSGDPSPSPEDIATTKRLVTAGRVLSIAVQDSLIVGLGGRTFSFHQAGLMPAEEAA